MAIFGISKKKHHPSPKFEQQPKYQQVATSPIPIPYSEQSQQYSYFPPQSLPSETPSYGQIPWVPPPYQPYKVTVSQTYLIPQQSPSQMKDSDSGCPHIAKLMAGAVTVTNLLQGDVPDCVPGARLFNNAHYFPIQQPQGTESLAQTAALYERISSKFDAVVTLIDGEKFSGDDKELDILESFEPVHELDRSIIPGHKVKSHGKSKGGAGCPITSTITSVNHFAKVNLYANSRLPLNLPPMKLYITTYPILCLAAEYAERVYLKPNPAEKETHLEADCRLGTKAMVIKSIPMDDMGIIVFAIRGSQTFMDWAVNLHTAPSSPTNILDDPGNLCHSGFLSVAQKMIIPVAKRLRQLLSELHNGQQRSTKNYSLLITGHSAGGAVASLLYSHMISTSPETKSQLRDLTPKFKRIHCITFGAPPVSLLPLTKPRSEKLKKSIFLSFVNEGDPVARADKKYIRSLLDLYSTPPPGQGCFGSSSSNDHQDKLKPWASGTNVGSQSTTSLSPGKQDPNLYPNSASTSTLLPPNRTSPNQTSPPLPARPSAPAPIWRVPESELSNAGRIIVLRSVSRYGHPTHPPDPTSHGKTKTKNRKEDVRERLAQGVIAQTISDAELRGVVWGDPVCHMMRLYARRIEVLATNAVMGRS